MVIILNQSGPTRATPLLRYYLATGSKNEGFIWRTNPNTVYIVQKNCKGLIYRVYLYEVFTSTKILIPARLLVIRSDLEIFIGLLFWFNLVNLLKITN